MNLECVSINATGDVIAVGAYYNDGESGSNPSNNANNGSVRVYGGMGQHGNEGTRDKWRTFRPFWL